MAKKTIRLVFGLAAMVFALGSCQSKNEIRRVNGSRPKEADKKVELKKLYAIDVTRIDIFGREREVNYDNVMVFDGRHRLYILDRGRGTIWVFDENGRFVRSFGGLGQGPKEFYNPSMLFIKDDKIHVLHAMGSEFKVLSLEGEYLSTRQVSFENPLRFISITGDVYLFSVKIYQTFTKLDFFLRRYPGGRFDQGEVLLTSHYPPGFREPRYNFVWSEWLLVSDSGEFYFLEDDFNKYSIVKYDREGKPSLVFGRKYEIREYSQKTKELLDSISAKSIQAGERKFPVSPPVVRKMFQDPKKNIWVLSGETSEDNEDPDFENTVDVFAPKGEWLFSLKSKIISKNCLYRNGRIYKITPVHPETYEQFIEVYSLEY